MQELIVGARPTRWPLPWQPFRDIVLRASCLLVLPKCRAHCLGWFPSSSRWEVGWSFGADPLVACGFVRYVHDRLADLIVWVSTRNQQGIGCLFEFLRFSTCLSERITLPFVVVMTKVGSN